MKIGIGQNWQEPSDSEIERDVAELRRMLDGVEGPREPHPAYWQNFLVHTRQRIDEQQARRRRFSPSVAWASLSAATLAVILVVGGIIPTSINHTTIDPSGNGIAASQPILSTENGKDILGLMESDGELATSLSIGGAPAIDQSSSILLSNDDAKMINAIMSEEDDDAVLTAMVETGGSL
jgi:hypothetical protein